MYFDVAPKDQRKDLFGMEYLVDSLVSHLKDDSVRMVVIKGLRRTGKTSLLNVALSEIKQKHVKIDVRESPYYDRREFMSYIAGKIKSELGESFFQKILKNVSGIKFSYKDMHATVYFGKEKNFFTFFEEMNEQLKKRKTYFALAFDEAQLLEKINFDYILASIYDNYKNIKIALTGSEIGLMDKFLGKKDAESPLFGRALIEIETQKLSSTQIGEFLTEGMKQIKRKIHLNELQEIIENFDGIIGWSTQYGWMRSKNFSHESAVSKTMEESLELVKRELNNFLAKRKSAAYVKVLKSIAKNYNKWNLIKSQLLRSGIKVSDSQLNLYLKELLDYSFIEKANGAYLITDPILIKAVS